MAQNSPKSHARQGLKPWDVDLETQALISPHGPFESNRAQAESISVASVWQMDSPQTADEALAGKSGVFAYRRDGHPNERALAERLALLHGAERVLLTAQGMSALAAVALALVKPGAHIWVANELYGKSLTLFCQELTRWNIAVTMFNPTCEKELKRLNGAADVDMVLIETMSNPRLRVPDVKAIRAACGSATKLVVDNTFATHLLCQPITLGADIVVESLGKQVNGHSDAMVGLIATREDTIGERIGSCVSTFGMASSPLDCFLTQRGLSTLALRCERACDNALALADALADVPSVQVVDYPGLQTHPQHTLAATQLRGGFGWMLSIHLDLDRAGVQRLFERLRPEVPFVPSLGDVTTTVSHPASTSHRGMSEQQRGELGISEGTVRISCGLEPTNWLVEHIRNSISR